MDQLTFTKEEVRNAYLNKKRNRNFLLFQLYQKIFMQRDYTHEVIATKLSQDLEYPISMSVVNNIRCRFVKREEQEGKLNASIDVKASRKATSGSDSINRKGAKPQSAEEDAELPSASDKKEAIIAGRIFTNTETKSKDPFKDLD